MKKVTSQTISRIFVKKWGNLSPVDAVSRGQYFFIYFARVQHSKEHTVYTCKNTEKNARIHGYKKHSTQIVRAMHRTLLIQVNCVLIHLSECLFLYVVI